MFVIVETPRKSDFHAKVAKLQRKAVKLGLPAPQVTLESSWEEKTTHTDDYGYEVTEVRSYERYAVENPSVQVAGWTLAARIDHNPLIVSKSPQCEIRVAWLFSHPNRDAICEHCNLSRNRKTTYIITNDDDGTIMQVGKTCLKDFFGIDVQSMFDFDVSVGALDGDWTCSSPGNPGIEMVMNVTHAVIKVYGWTSRGKARDTSNEATADIVSDIVFALLHKGKCRNPEITEALKDTGDLGSKVVAWVKGLNPQTDYEHNLVSLFKFGFVDYKHFGLACSAVSGYLRAHAVTEAKVESNHVGTPGDKFGRKLSAADKRKGVTAHPAIIARVTGVFYSENDWGCTTILRFICEAGNRFTWFASGYREIEVGDQGNIVATLKKHDEYKGIKGNVLTRCAITWEGE